MGTPRNMTDIKEGGRRNVNADAFNGGGGGGATL